MTRTVSAEPILLRFTTSTQPVTLQQQNSTSFYLQWLNNFRDIFFEEDLLLVLILLVIILMIVVLILKSVKVQKQDTIQRIW